MFLYPERLPQSQVLGQSPFSDDFKRDAVTQITERGYPVAEVADWLGISNAFTLRVEEAVLDAGQFACR